MLIYLSLTGFHKRGANKIEILRFRKEIEAKERLRNSEPGSEQKKQTNRYKTAINWQSRTDTRSD